MSPRDSGEPDGGALRTRAPQLTCEHEDRAIDRPAGLCTSPATRRRCHRRQAPHPRGRPWEPENVLQAAGQVKQSTLSLSHCPRLCLNGDCMGSHMCETCLYMF